MFTVLFALFCMTGNVEAADPNSPHPHTGVSTKFSNPTPTPARPRRSGPSPRTDITPARSGDPTVPWHIPVGAGPARDRALPWHTFDH